MNPTDNVQREIDLLQSEQYFLLAYCSEVGGTKGFMSVSAAYKKNPEAFQELFKEMQQVLVKKGARQLSFF
jgi:hypothetical protein